MLSNILWRGTNVIDTSPHILYSHHYLDTT